MTNFRPRSLSRGNKLKLSKDVRPIPKFEHPIFCFKYLREKKHGLKQCTIKEKEKLLHRLHKLSQMTWRDIQFAPKHGLGSEKIARKALSSISLPDIITPDVNFYAIRFDGPKPMIGFRTDYVFHIVFLDTKMKAYKHY